MRTVSPADSEFGGLFTTRSDTGPPPENFHLGAEIAPKCDRLELDFVVRADGGDLQPVLAKDQCAGRQPHYVRIARQLQVACA